MNQQKKRICAGCLGGLFVLMMTVYFVRLVQLQILKGSDYLAQVESTYSSVTKLNAARGEITDRYGRVLAGNRTANNVVLEKAYIGPGDLNRTVADLCRLLADCGVRWIDNLPLEMDEKGTVRFPENRKPSIDAMKKFLRLQSYATAENCFDALTARFELAGGKETYTRAQQREIVGVRYEMEQTGFSMNNNYTFAENVDNDALIRIKESSYRLPGVNVEQVPIRTYFSGPLIPHVIGTIGPIYAEEAKDLLAQGYALNEKVGKSGIEAYAESYLRGKSGLREIVRNKNGDIIADNVKREPVAGAAVSLTIDAGLDAFVQSALRRNVEYIKKTYPFAKDTEGAAIVVIDCNTFEVLASATYPSYDINDYMEHYDDLVKEKYNPLYNRVTQASYRPGSIFKPIVGSIAIDDGLIDANSTVNCTHIYNYYPDSPMKCLGHHGPTNVVRALKFSCNIFFYDVGRRLGIEKLSDGCEKYFGIGQKTGIQIGETAGVMSSPETKKQIQGVQWYPGDTLQAAIGQMDTLVTPLQMAAYTATIANGGTRKQVSIIHEILPADYAGDPLWTNPETVLSEFPNRHNALAAVHDGMIQAAPTYGGFRGLGFPVAAKTGSPQITNDLSFGTFITFAPADKPEIAIAAVGEKMTHGYVLSGLCNESYHYYFNDRRAAEPVAGDNVLLP